MYVKIKHCLPLLFFSILTVSVTAIPFNSSVQPTELNSTISALLNFSIGNMNVTGNITRVNISLPTGFTYLGNPNTSVSDASFVKVNDSMLAWTGTPAVANNSIEYFWFNVSASVVGYNYNFTIFVLDSSDVLNSTNVPVNVTDVTPPAWSNNSTYPTSPTTYSPTATYQFNITWSDNIQIDKVIFNWNGTNYTYPNVTNSSNVFSISFSSLQAGEYTYYWFANDTSGNFNQTNSLVYNITKSPNPISIWFNSTKNDDIVAINGTYVVITGEGFGTLKLFNDTVEIATNATCVSSCSLSYSTPVYSTHKYNITVTAAGNVNYTSNSSTYYIMTVPYYTTSTSIVSTYTPNFLSKINISFPSDPGFTLTLEGDWTGTSTRYSMFRYAGTNTYSYNVTLPAGSFYWKIYGNYSNYIFNLTTNNSFTVNKRTPTLTLTAFLWSITVGTQSNVSCTADTREVTPHLYRNGIAVSNPDVSTLDVGSYTYVCSSTATQNYSASSISNTLVVSPQPVANLTFLQVPSKIMIEQGGSNSSTVNVNNTGTVTQNVTLTVEGIDENWWEVSPNSKLLSAGRNTTFSIIFSVGNVTIGEYQGVFNVSSENNVLTHEFILLVLPNNQTKLTLNNTLEDYRVKRALLEAKIDQLKSLGLNTSTLEQKLNEFKEKLELAENYMKDEDYINLNKMIQTLSLAYEDVKNEIENVEKAQQIMEEEKAKRKWKKYGLIAGVIIVGSFIAYLFWPSEIKSEAPIRLPPQEREPKPEKVKFSEKIREFFSKLSRKLVRKKKYQYRG